eukprot:2419430-Amphidinium_carterae.1
MMRLLKLHWRDTLWACRRCSALPKYSKPELDICLEQGEPLPHQLHRRVYRMPAVMMASGYLSTVEFTPTRASKQTGQQWVGKTPELSH